MGLTIKVTLTQNSQNIANNTSSVTAKVIAYYTNGSWNQIGNDGTLTLNGTTYSFIGKFNTGKSSGSGSTTMYTVTVTIPHNADGSKTVTASVSYPTSTWGDKSASASLNLTQIPRKATVVSAPNFNDEGNPTITYSNPAGSAVTSLKACISLDGAADDIAYRDISKTGTSYTFSLTDAERAVLRKATASSNSRSVRFYVQTVIGGVTYLHYLSKTLSIVNANPSLSPTVADIDSVMLELTGSDSRIVKYYSNPQYAVNATALKGASIKSYKVTCGSKSLTTATGTFYDVESNVVSLTATDSRGNSTTKTVTLTLVNYVKLTCNPTFTYPDTNGSISFPIRGNYFSGSFGSTSNTLTVQYRYKYTTDTGEVVDYGEWVTVEPTIEGTTYNAAVSLTGLNYLYSYTFQVRAVDKIATVNAEATVQARPVFDWGKDDFNINGNLGLSGKGTVLRRNGENGNVVLSAPDATDGIFFRPNGTGSADGQMIVQKNGNIQNNGWTVSKASDIAYSHQHPTTGVRVSFGVGSAGTNHGVYSYPLNGWMLFSDGTNTYLRQKGTYYSVGMNKTLWSGGWYMTSVHTANLASAVSAQTNGIVIVFSGYTNGASENSYFHAFFVPKGLVAAHPGVGHHFLLATTRHDTVASKYLYIHDTYITGNDGNSETGTGSTSGVAYNNTRFVMRYVYGV